MNMMVSAAAVTAAATVACAGDRSDAELMKLGAEYERLLAIEQPLREEKSRRWEETCRLRDRLVGIDPDADHEDRDAARREIGWEKWNAAWAPAMEQSGCGDAYDAWIKLTDPMNEIGLKINELTPNTLDGLLVRALIVENEEQVFDLEPAEQLIADLRDFAQRQKDAHVAP